jgi:hypothetical protein
MKRAAIPFFMMMSWFLCSSVIAQQTRDMPVGDFRKLTLQGNLRVALMQGEKAQVQIIGSQADQDEVTMTTSGGELTLKTKHLDVFDNKDRHRRRIKVLVTFASLTHLHTGRGAEVRGKSVVAGDDLEIEAHSGSNLDLDILVTSLHLEAGEGAQVNLSGKATVQKTAISTGAELNASSLESEVVNIRSNTGANAEVSASKRIEASAGTGGNIRYKGRPTQRDINTSLGGSVSQL